MTTDGAARKIDVDDCCFIIGSVSLQTFSFQKKEGILSERAGTKRKMEVLTKETRRIS
jgi:hypothetical protein